MCKILNLLKGKALLRTSMYVWSQISQWVNNVCFLKCPRWKLEQLSFALITSASLVWLAVLGVDGYRSSISTSLGSESWSCMLNFICSSILAMLCVNEYHHLMILGHATSWLRLFSWQLLVPRTLTKALNLWQKNALVHQFTNHRHSESNKSVMMCCSKEWGRLETERNQTLITCRQRLVIDWMSSASCILSLQYRNVFPLNVAIAASLPFPPSK